MYKTDIPISTKTAESPASGHSQLSYDPSGAASIAYRELAKEVLEHGRANAQKHVRDEYSTSLLR